MNKWMNYISNEELLSEINLPGTHDSCTCCVQFAFISKCQSMSITEQFNCGIRLLDVRVEKDGNLSTILQIAKTHKKRARNYILIAL